MDSSQDNKLDHHSADELICWNTPETKKNNSDSYRIDYINNPFDKLELKAANMDPFDLVHNQITPKNDPPCGNIISPIWKSEVSQLQNNISLTTDVTKIEELSHIEHANNNILIDQLKDDSFEIYANKEIFNISKENYAIHVNENKLDNKIQIFKSITNSNHNDINVENIILNDEDEKSQIRKQTRQRIDMFIEKEKEKHENINSRKSSNIIDNDVNESIFPDQEFFKNSFDLNSLQPEWLEDDFIDLDGSFSEIIRDKSLTIIEKSDCNVDDKLKIESIESKPNGSETIQNKQNNGSLVTNISLQKMTCIHNNNQENNHMKPVAQSTPALNKTTMFKIPLLGESSIKSNNNLLWQPVSNVVRSPMTTLNITTSYKENSINILNGQISTLSTALPLTKSRSKHSNTTVVLSNEVNKGNIENTRKTFQFNKSKSENKIYKIPKKMEVNTNRLSGLPIPKYSTILFKGKENVKLQ